MIPRLPKGFTHPMPIGKGSFSSVYRVRQSALDRWVAIKVLAEKSSERRRDLLKEARGHAQLRVSGIPALYDAFEWRGQVCMVMQWIKGVSLEVLLETGIPADQKGPLSSALLACLAGLHHLGYAHRDLKPANILVSPEEGIFLVDFGFARKVDRPDQSMAGFVIGTPLYMAPELWKSGDADTMRADLYSLGKILQQIGAGEPWTGLVQALLKEDPGVRPASAAVAWTDWQGRLAGPAKADWKALTGKLASGQLAHHLVQAAKELLFAGREEEAYWLGIESLESDPDSAEAVRLLDQVPAASRRRKRIRLLWKAGLAAAFAIALGAAFFAGRRSGGPVAVLAAGPQAESKALLLPSAPAAVPITAVALREFSGPGGLAGRFAVKDAAACDSLRLDGRLFPRETAFGGISLLAGDHLVACRCAATQVPRRERFRLLPFQEKSIHLCPAPLEGT